MSMFSWIKRAFDFVKGIVSTYSALKELQLQAKDATIQMQKENIDLLSRHLSLSKDAGSQELDDLTKKFKEVEASNKQSSEALLAVVNLLINLLRKTVPEIGKRLGRYAEARGRMIVAMKIVAYRAQRLSHGSDPAARVLPFVRDMDLVAAQEVKAAAKELISFIDQGGSEEFPGARSFFEEAIKWASREEDRVSRIHTLPSVSDSEEST